MKDEFISNGRIDDEYGERLAVTLSHGVKPVGECVCTHQVGERESVGGQQEAEGQEDGAYEGMDR